MQSHVLSKVGPNRSKFAGTDCTVTGYPVHLYIMKTWWKLSGPVPEGRFVRILTLRLAFYPRTDLSHCLVLILDGNSDIGAHVMTARTG